MQIKRKLLQQQWWVWVMLGLFILTVTGLIISFYLFQPWLKQKLESAVQEKSKGLYELNIGKLNASLLTSNVSARNVSLNVNLKQLELQKKIPAQVFDAQIKLLQVKGINYLELLFGKPLDLTKIGIYDAAVMVYKIREDTVDAPLYKTLNEPFKGLRIANIEVKNTAIKFKSDHKNKYADRMIEQLNLQVSDYRIDSQSYHHPDRAFYAEAYTVKAASSSYLLPDGMYRLKSGALSADSKNGAIKVKNLRMVPLLKQGEMSERKGMAVTRIDLSVPVIEVKHFGFPALFRQGDITAETIELSQPRLKAYLDRKNFAQKGNKPLPHDLVQEMDIGLAIQKVLVRGMQIRYEELAPQASETGHITMENLYATITNITNDKNRMSGDNPAVVDAKAEVMGKGTLETTIRLNLLDPDCYHRITGSIGTVNAQVLNPILEPTSFLSVKSGTIQGGSFNMELYRNNASGTLRAAYKNLKVDLLTKDDDTRQSFGKKILSKVANKLVLNSDNNGNEERAGNINVVRAKRKSFFNYWKDCLLSGFKDIIGAKGMGPDLQDPAR